MNYAKTKKQQAYRRGIVGEYGAVAYFMLRGFWLVERRFKCGAGEVDLILRRGKTLVMAEVKTRGKDAQEVLLAQQRKRISNAAAIYLAKHPEFASFFVRFDVVILTPWRWPRHIPNAWEVHER